MFRRLISDAEATTDTGDRNLRTTHYDTRNQIEHTEVSSLLAWQLVIGHPQVNVMQGGQDLSSAKSKLGRYSSVSRDVEDPISPPLREAVAPASLTGARGVRSLRTE